MKRIHLDANVVLRFLRNDDPLQSLQAAALFQQAQASEDIELIVSAITVMEVFYVLNRAYGLPRAEVARILAEFLHTGVATCVEDEIVLDALARITGQKISFGDAYLAASTAMDNAEAASFDQGMRSFSDARLYRWQGGEINAPTPPGTEDHRR